MSQRGGHLPQRRVSGEMTMDNDMKKVFEDWLDEEHPHHNPNFFDTLGEYHSWLRTNEVAFRGGWEAARKGIALDNSSGA